MSTKYFKITNAEENHHGFQYADGLNILNMPFEEKGSCVPGGLYFSDAKNILEFLSFGVYLREITLPTTDSDFKMVEIIGQNKWRANKIILGKRRNLAERSTWEYLLSLGSKYLFWHALKWASTNGSLDVINFLTEREKNLSSSYKIYVLDKASKYGHIEIVKFLIKNGIDPNNNRAISLASKNGHLEIIKFLSDVGIDFENENDRAIRGASKNGHLNVVKFLIEKGANPKNDDNIKLAAENGESLDNCTAII